MENLRENWLGPEGSYGFEIEITNETGNSIIFKVGSKIPTGKNENGILKYSDNAIIKNFAVDDNDKITHVMIDGVETPLSSELPNNPTILTIDDFFTFVTNRLPEDEQWSLSREFTTEELLV